MTGHAFFLLMAFVNVNSQRKGKGAMEFNAQADQAGKLADIEPATQAGTVDMVDGKRRKLIQGAGLAAGTGMLGLTSGGAWAAGSDKPEKEEVKIGFIPLTDCASVVMASVLGFDKKYGIKIVPSKEASWAACATS